MQSSPAHTKPIHVVDNRAALEQCVEDLNKQPAIAFDLEFDSHSYAYGFTLALIQVGTPNTCYIIDPFAAIDIKGLYFVFENEGIQKIVHTPGEDLRLLHTQCCYPRNIFDTEVTAKLLNYENTSLAAMIQEKLGYTMSKQQQRSNWLLRPLTAEQIEYAANDVAWLHELKAVLEGEAAEKGLMPFVCEEQQLFSTNLHKAEAKTFFLKGPDLFTLSPYEQYVLNALFIYRDELAQKHNKPAYQMIDEPLLRSLAANTLEPHDLLKEKRIYGGFKNTKFTKDLEDRLQEIHAEAMDLTLSHEPPPRQRLSNAERIAREDAEKDKKEKFAPIQQELAKRYGANAARFLFSNGLVNDMVRRTQSIGGLKQHYRQELIRNIAKELGIDIYQYD